MCEFSREGLHREQKCYWKVKVKSFVFNVFCREWKCCKTKSYEFYKNIGLIQRVLLLKSESELSHRSGFLKEGICRDPVPGCKSDIEKWKWKCFQKSSSVILESDSAESRSGIKKWKVKVKTILQN